MKGLPTPSSFIVPDIMVNDRVRVVNKASEFYGATGEVYRVWEGIVWAHIVYEGREASIGFRPSSLEKVR